MFKYDILLQNIHRNIITLHTDTEIVLRVAIIISSHLL